MNDAQIKNPLMDKVIFQGREYLTSHRIHADYRAAGGEKYDTVSSFNKMIRGIEAFIEYCVAQNIVELSAKSQVIDLSSNSNLDLLIKSNSYKPVMLLDKPANVAVMNFLENEASRKFAVQGNTYLAEKLTAGPSLEDFMARTETMFRENLVTPFREICQDMKAGMVGLREDVLGVRNDVSRIEQKTNDNSNSIKSLGLQVDKIMASRRRGFKNEDIASYVRAIDRYYSGNCPCCHETKVVDNGLMIKGMAEKDHFYGRHLNKKQDGWIICIHCHNKKTQSGKFQKTATPAFDQFQTMLENMPNHQESIPGIAA